MHSTRIDPFSPLHAQIRSKRGFKKIMNTCRQAKAWGLGWAWVDTCCIDKTSSAELSEAINSMYQWYKASSICYVYLSDVLRPEVSDSRQFRSSRWFTRGWTLQELIAPSKMEFFGLGWKYIGSRASLGTIISNITNIPVSLMTERRCWRWSFHDCDFSVAQKMSWAASRKCTRIEDSAYCMIGLFDIAMPLLYGEGKKAFLRLQEEIFRTTDDHSLLAWTATSHPATWQRPWAPASVFAVSPLNFVNSSNIVRLHEEGGDPSAVTKKGLQISLPLKEGSHLTSQRYTWESCPEETFHAILNCGIRRAGETNRILLLVARDTGSNKDVKQSRCYSRLVTSEHVGVHDHGEFQDPSKYETIFLRTQRHKYPTDSFRRGIQRLIPIQFHVHYGLDFNGMEASEGHTNPAIEITMKKAHFVTGTEESLVWEPNKLESGNIFARDKFFILRARLHSSVGPPPIEAYCRIERHGFGRCLVQLWLESKSNIRPCQMSGKASQYVNIVSFTRHLMSVSFLFESYVFNITLRCRCSSVKEAPKQHFDINVSCTSMLLSSIEPSTTRHRTELSPRTWRKRDFFSLFEQTSLFLQEKERQLWTYKSSRNADEIRLTRYCLNLVKDDVRVKRGNWWVLVGREIRGGVDAAVQAAPK
jgi:hypothetical protein